MDDNELADLVQKNLKDQRYLVVVDEIWSSDVWDSIRGIFPICNNGSRILLTTRETEVAMYAGAYTGEGHRVHVNPWSPPEIIYSSVIFLKNI
uniref:NBS-coding resistance gene analog n=1 Tax=Solanum tuberosum TaxID=4113 RepID=M0ZZN5_SOLTU